MTTKYPHCDLAGLTRRDFMKKTALAVGAAGLLAQGLALESGTGSGCESEVQGTPSKAEDFSGVVVWDGISARLKITCTPEGEPSGLKTLVVVGEGWTSYDPTVATSDAVKVVGSIEAGCTFVGKVEPDTLDTHSALIDDWDRRIDHPSVVGGNPEGWEDRFEQWVTSDNEWTGIRQQMWIYVYMEIIHKEVTGDLALVRAKVYPMKKEKLSKYRGSVESVAQPLTEFYPTTWEEMEVRAEKVS